MPKKTVTFGFSGLPVKLGFGLYGFQGYTRGSILEEARTQGSLGTRWTEESRTPSWQYISGLTLYS